MKLGRLLVPEVRLGPARRRLAAVPDHRDRGAEDVGRPTELLGPVGDGHRAVPCRRPREKGALRSQALLQVARQNVFDGDGENLRQTPPANWRGCFWQSPPPPASPRIGGLEGATEITGGRETQGQTRGAEERERDRDREDLNARRPARELKGEELNAIPPI